MPRVGLTKSEQTSGGSLFSFPEGKGEIVGAVICNHEIPGYPPAKCGYKLSIQPLDNNWQPTSDEPIEEFMACGPVSKFHPGIADGPNDRSAELEIGGSKDAGDANGAEGNCLLSVSGAGPDKKSKSVVFCNSLIDAGIKNELIDGYAPHLVGLKATFTQKMMERGKDYTGKSDPTNLIVGVGGKEAGAVVHQWPGSAAQNAAPAPIKQAAGKPAANTTAVAGSAPASGNGVASDGDVIEATAMQLLVALADSSAGQTLTRAKIGSKMVTLLAKNRVPTAQHKPVRAMIENDAWFLEKAVDMQWQYDTVAQAVTFPAAG